METVTFNVGKNETMFRIHHDVLGQQPNDLKNIHDHSLRHLLLLRSLVRMDADHFELLVVWLYDGVYELPAEQLCSTNRLMEPVRLYIMAEKLKVTELQQHLMDIFYNMAKRGEEMPSRYAIQVAFDRALPSSPIKKLLADWWALVKQVDLYENSGERTWLVDNPKFALELVIALSKKASGQEAFASESAERYY